MKGIRLYLILLGILLAVSIYFFMNRRSGSYAPSKREFAVTDTGSIAYVRISAYDRQVSLLKTEGVWKVDGSPVRKESIQGLYVLLSRLEVEAPVSNLLEGRIKGGIENLATEVLIGMEDGREKIYRVYFDSLSGSTFMMIEGSDIAFRVRVRGYKETNLATLFSADLRFWRDNVIFQHLPGEIMAINLRNNRQPETSFQLLRNEKGDFEVSGGAVPDQWSLAQDEKVRQYLWYFNNVRFEFFLNPAADTLEHAEDPEYVLTLEQMNRERHQIGFFPVYHVGEDGERQLDYDRLYARFERGGEWVVVKYVQIDPLLKDFKYFKTFKK